MRAHKYRVFNTVDKVMIDKPNSPRMIDGVLTFDADDIGMEWTGLTDKNGVDVFEGDIIKSVSEIIKPFADRNKQKTGKMATSYKAIEYRDKVASFCIAGSSLSSISQKVATTYYEVVGNIYQDSELLEAKP